MKRQAFVQRTVIRVRGNWPDLSAFTFSGYARHEAPFKDDKPKNTGLSGHIHVANKIKLVITLRVFFALNVQIAVHKDDQTSKTVNIHFVLERSGFGENNAGLGDDGPPLLWNVVLVNVDIIAVGVEAMIKDQWSVHEAAGVD